MEATLSSLKTTILAVILAMAIFLFTLTKWGSSLFSSTATTKWPAGPKTLPIIGNLHQLGGEVLHVALLKLAKIHGGVMTIWMGSRRPVIVVSDIKEAWEVLVSKSSDYSARDLPELVKITSAGLRTISSTDSGPFWHNLRKGLQNGPLSPLSILAQINFQETDILRMIKDIQEEAKIKGGIVKPLDHLKIATVRLLSRLIFGQNFDHDSFIESMHHEIDALIRVIVFGRPSDVFSFAKYLPSHRRNVKQLHQIKLALQELIRPHLLALEPPSNSYLNFLISQDYQEDVIIACIAELYLLGVDSIASSTMWALTFLIHDQAAQEKLYQQIKPYATKSECGLIKTHDLSHLPYLQAVMKETMRMKPIAPLAIPHKACKDTSLKGTMVAKGTVVMVNIYALHHDHNIWTDPYKFMPQRFLQGDGEATGQSFLPFGGGMRSCAGMELGKLQFSLALANLVNVFEWTSVVDGKLPDMTEELTFVILMKTTLESRIIPRNQ